MVAFVVGGAGFLGMRIANAFAAEGHEVVCADINAMTLPVVFDPKIRFIRIDVTQFEDVLASMSASKPDIVVNLAAMRENLPRPAMKLNVFGMDNVLEAARICKVSRVVYASSIAVYGAQRNYGDHMIVETDPVKPLKQYDVHKIFNEWQAKEYREKHGMSVIGLRPTNTAGTDKGVGAVDHVDVIVKPAKGEKVRLDYRDRMRCLMHGDDAAKMFLRIAVEPAPKHTIYNTGGEVISMGRIAEIVRDVIPDADISFEHETGGKERSSAYLTSNERYISEFGPLNLMPYEKRIHKMIENVRNGVVLG